jgi:hypothetical protein
MTSYPLKWLLITITKIETQKTIGVGKNGCSKIKTPCTDGGNIKWCSHYGNSREDPQITKNRTII